MKCSEELIAIRDHWHCAKHPFYDRLSEGTLDIKSLGSFLVQHSLLVHQIFRSIGVTYSKSPDDIAYFILENLAEEAGIIGIDDGEAHDHRDLIHTLLRPCRMMRNHSPCSSTTAVGWLVGWLVGVLVA